MNNLLSADRISLEDIFNSKSIAAEWEAISPTLDQFTIPDGTGGVNPGDRRAIYYLTRHLKPKNVLEIGTHIGASTLYLAGALEENATLTSVDIIDVNGQEGLTRVEKGLTRSGTPLSPLEMLQSAGWNQRVQFVKSSSLDYLSRTKNFLDFVFLDGDHSKSTVSAEIPLVLKRLNPGGIILLHDYFPENKPLWKDYWGGVIEGPYLAVEKLRNQGYPIRAIPLGELPWPTTLNSNITSLALVLHE
jgi:predicted O-methyltransferase YrrM